MTTSKCQPFAKRFQPVFYIEYGRLQQMIYFTAKKYGDSGLSWGQSTAGAFQAMIDLEADRSKYKGANSALCTLIPMSAVSWFINYHRTPKAIGTANKALTHILHLIRHLYMVDVRVGLYEFKWHGETITYVDPRFIQPVVHGLIQIPKEVYYGQQQMDPGFTFCPYIPKEAYDDIKFKSPIKWSAIPMNGVVVAIPKGGA